MSEKLSEPERLELVHFIYKYKNCESGYFSRDYLALDHDFKQRIDGLMTKARNTMITVNVESDDIRHATILKVSALTTFRELYQQVDYNGRFIVDGWGEENQFLFEQGASEINVKVTKET